jgi:hypothetical protein
MCYRCLDGVRDNIMRYGIEQCIGQFGEIVPLKNPMVFFNGHTLMFRLTEKWTRNGDYRYGYSIPMWDVSCWTNDKATFKLSEAEKIRAIVDPAEIFNMILRYENLRIFRCTGCGGNFPIELIAGRPLFAGKCCPDCWAKHLEFLEDERKKGHVCSMCRQPYGNCCC